MRKCTAKQDKSIRVYSNRDYIILTDNSEFRIDTNKNGIA